MTKHPPTRGRPSTPARHAAIRCRLRLAGVAGALLLIACSSKRAVFVVCDVSGATRACTPSVVGNIFDHFLNTPSVRTGSVFAVVEPYADGGPAHADLPVILPSFRTPLDPDVYEAWRRLSREQVVGNIKTKVHRKGLDDLVPALVMASHLKKALALHEDGALIVAADGFGFGSAVPASAMPSGVEIIEGARARKQVPDLSVFSRVTFCGFDRTSISTDLADRRMLAWYCVVQFWGGPAPRFLASCDALADDNGGHDSPHPGVVLASAARLRVDRMQIQFEEGASRAQRARRGR